MFGRKRPAARARIAYTEPAPARRPQLGTTGWAPGPGTPHPSQQIGRYAGTMLTQYPAMPREVQRHQGVEYLRAGWYYPVTAGAVLPVQRTVRPNNTNSGQRYGMRYTGPLGPVNSQLLRGAVVDAQARTTTNIIAPWAAKLTGAVSRG